MSNSTQNEDESGEEASRPIVTYGLLAVIGVIYLAMAAASKWHFSSFPDPVCDLFGYKQNDRILQSGHLTQWWRFVTPIFLHGGLIHICVNSFSLYVIGIQLEPFYGSRRYFLLFKTAGIAGVLSSYHFSQNPSLGASGALFGLVGAGIMFPIRFRSLIPRAQGKRIVVQLTKVAVLNLGIGFMFSHYVDNYAHLGGLFGGMFAALFLVPDALDVRTDQRRALSSLGLWVGTAAMLILIAFSGIAQGRWALGPWWRITVPGSFRPVSRVSQFQGTWKSADGSSVEITDTVHNANLLPASLYFLQRQDVPENVLTVSGWHGRGFILQNNTQTWELYLIVAYGRVVAITMNAPTSKFAAEQPQFNKIMRSLKFLHTPPPDLHPIAVKKPAAGAASGPAVHK